MKCLTGVNFILLCFIAFNYPLSAFQYYVVEEKFGQGLDSVKVIHLSNAIDSTLTKEGYFNLSNSEGSIILLPENRPIRVARLSEIKNRIVIKSIQKTSAQNSLNIEIRNNTDFNIVITLYIDQCDSSVKINLSNRAIDSIRTTCYKQLKLDKSVLASCIIDSDSFVTRSIIIEKNRHKSKFMTGFLRLILRILKANHSHLIQLKLFQSPSSMRYLTMFR